VSISWSSVSGATSYNIYWSTTSGVTKTTGTKITGGTSPYTHTGLTNGTTYYYVVTAVNSYGESSESSQVTGTPTTAGGLGAWQYTSSMNTARVNTGIAANNGYIYAVGGRDGGYIAKNSVEVSHINADGTLGSWSSTSSLNNVRATHGVAIYNGYIYAVGGSCGYLCWMSSVEYAPINANGTLGTWSTTSSMNTSREYFNVAIYNGYLYAVGGGNVSGSSGYWNTVEYVRINADGTLGTWSYTSSLNTPRIGHGVVAYNNYLYSIGGSKSASYILSGEYAPINADGTIGIWSYTSSLNTTRSELGVAMYNGYIYAAGGACEESGCRNDSVEYAPINANGTVGTWSYTSSLNTARNSVNATAYNGYLYIVGGTDNAGPLNSVEYSPIN